MYSEGVANFRQDWVADDEAALEASIHPDLVDAGTSVREKTDGNTPIRKVQL
jgi:hypothetical protein